MPSGCAVVGCKRSSRSPAKLFWFPHSIKHSEQRKIWIRNVNRKDWIPGENSYVCSKHFVDGKPTDVNPYPVLQMGWNCPQEKGRKPPLVRNASPLVVIPIANVKKLPTPKQEFVNLLIPPKLDLAVNFAQQNFNQEDFELTPTDAYYKQSQKIGFEQMPRPKLGRPRLQPEDKVKRNAIQIHKDTFDLFLRFMKASGCETYNDAVLWLLNCYDEKCNCGSAKKKEKFDPDVAKEICSRSKSASTSNLQSGSANLIQINADKIKKEFDDSEEQMDLDSIKTEILGDEESPSCTNLHTVTIATEIQPMLFETSSSSTAGTSLEAMVKANETLHAENINLKNEVDWLQNKLHCLNVRYPERLAEFTALDVELQNLTKEIEKLRSHKRTLLDAYRSDHVDLVQKSPSATVKCTNLKSVRIISDDAVKKGKVYTNAIYASRHD